MMMIQKDPELWDLIEKIKDQDATLEFFLDDVAEMFAIEFRTLDTRPGKNCQGYENFERENQGVRNILKIFERV